MYIVASPKISSHVYSAELRIPRKSHARLQDFHRPFSRCTPCSVWVPISAATRIVNTANKQLHVPASKITPTEKTCTFDAVLPHTTTQEEASHGVGG